MAVIGGARLAPSEEVLVRRVRNELVLLHLGSEVYFGLDPVGAAMWEALCATGSIEGAHAVLLSEFDVEPELLSGDLHSLVAQMLEQGLLVAE